MQATRAVNTQLLRSSYRDVVARVTTARTPTAGDARYMVASRPIREAGSRYAGITAANLLCMRIVAGVWPLEAIVQQPVGYLLWDHLTVLNDRAGPGCPATGSRSASASWSCANPRTRDLDTSATTFGWCAGGHLR